MDRILMSPWFLACTAVCSGVAVACASWVAGGVGVVSLLAGLAFALSAMLIVAWALGANDAPAVPAAVEPAPEAVASAPPVTRDALERRLAAGHALRDELEPGAADDRVAAWIDDARATVERETPGAAGYFNALAAREYADDAERLDAHLRRLGTIVRDLL